MHAFQYSLRIDVRKKRPHYSHHSVQLSAFDIYGRPLNHIKMYSYYSAGRVCGPLLLWLISGLLLSLLVALFQFCLYCFADMMSLTQDKALLQHRLAALCRHSNLLRHRIIWCLTLFVQLIVSLYINRFYFTSWIKHTFNQCYLVMLVKLWSTVYDMQLQYMFSYAMTLYVGLWYWIEWPDILCYARLLLCYARHSALY